MASSTARGCSSNSSVTESNSAGVGSWSPIHTNVSSWRHVSSASWTRSWPGRRFPHVYTAQSTITTSIVTQDGAMDRASYLASVRRDGDLLLSTAADGLDRPVPTCPGWTAERLVGHIGRTHRWTA